MADVWAARVSGPQGFTKVVALKFMLADETEDHRIEKALRNEARIASTLDHPNIVSIHDFDRAPDDAPAATAGRYYIAMERVDGRDLSDLLSAFDEDGTPLPITVAMFIANEIMSGLKFLHGREKFGGLSLIQRDLSPENVLLGYAGVVKISDFGIARSASAPTTGGAVWGKLGTRCPSGFVGSVPHI